MITSPSTTAGIALWAGARFIYGKQIMAWYPGNDMNDIVDARHTATDLLDVDLFGVPHGPNPARALAVAVGGIGRRREPRSASLQPRFLRRLWTSEVGRSAEDFLGLFATDSLPASFVEPPDLPGPRIEDFEGLTVSD